MEKVVLSSQTSTVPACLICHRIKQSWRLEKTSKIPKFDSNPSPPCPLTVTHMPHLHSSWAHPGTVTAITVQCHWTQATIPVDWDTRPTPKMTHHFPLASLSWQHRPYASPIVRKIECLSSLHPASNGQKKSLWLKRDKLWNHKIIESLWMKKTIKSPKSNPSPSPPMPTNHIPTCHISEVLELQAWLSLNHLEKEML